MTEHLRQIISQIEQLPADQQESYAEVLQSMLEADHQWDELLSDPRSEDVLEDLIAQAKEEVRQGKTFSIDQMPDLWTRPSHRASRVSSMLFLLQ